jgi:hypothetical protein
MRNLVKRAIVGVAQPETNGVLAAGRRVQGVQEVACRS